MSNKRIVAAGRTVTQEIIVVFVPNDSTANLIVDDRPILVKGIHYSNETGESYAEFSKSMMDAVIQDRARLIFSEETLRTGRVDFVPLQCQNVPRLVAKLKRTSASEFKKLMESVRELV